MHQPLWLPVVLLNGALSQATQIPAQRVLIVFKIWRGIFSLQYKVMTGRNGAWRELFRDPDGLCI